MVNIKTTCCCCFSPLFNEHTLSRGRLSLSVRVMLVLGWRLQYGRLGELSVGPISYSEDESGDLLPLIICKRLYRKRSMDVVKQIFVIDTDLERGEESASSLTPKCKCCALISQSRSLSFFLCFFFFSLFVISSKVCKTVENTESQIFGSGFLQVCRRSCFF